MLTIVMLLMLSSLHARAQQTWHVAPGGTGTGSTTTPFGRIQDGLRAALPGDTVLIAKGTYAESIATVRAGADGAPITIKARDGARTVVVSRAASVLSVTHPHHTIDGLVIDGNYAAADAVRVSSAGDRLVFRNGEVRRSGRDCVDIGAADDVLIENTVIARCLWWSGQREDAHGIVATGVKRLTVRNVQISAFSGDAIQLDPARSVPGWDDVLIEGSTFSLAPLAAAENGFPAGSVPGENGIDTKASGAAARATLTVRTTTASGFKGGLINNMAAFNIKENVDATFDRVTVTSSTIGFRLRGPGANGGAWVTITNAVLHDLAYGVRYEDDIEQARLAHVTFGAGVARPLIAASSGWAGVDVRNSAFLAGSLPVEAPAAAGNLAVTTAAFANASAQDYRLVAGSPLVDTAVGALATTEDYSGTRRPQGGAADVGAYELTQVSAAPAAPTGLTVTLSTSGTTPTATLRWKDTSSNEAGFNVEKSTDGSRFTLFTSRGANASWANGGSVTRGATYWFRVRAFNAAGPGPYTPVVKVTVP